MGPSPNAGRPAPGRAPDGRCRPVAADPAASGRGSRACTPSLLQGARAIVGPRAPTAARVQRTAPCRHASAATARGRRPSPCAGRGRARPACDNPPDDDSARTRPNHVRPRPPSAADPPPTRSGPPPRHPAASPAIDAGPAWPRHAAHRPARLALALVALGRRVSCTSASGGLGRVVGAIGVDGRRIRRGRHRDAVARARPSRSHQRRAVDRVARRAVHEPGGRST